MTFSPAVLLLSACAAPAHALTLADPETAASGLVLLTGLIWLSLLFVPFAPGISELLRPQDDAPLNINWDFVKDPFYFFRSFRKMMRDKARHFPKEGIAEIHLSKPEKVHVFGRLRGGDGGKYPHIVYAREGVSAGKDSRFRKEIYSLGDISSGPGSSFRALGSEGAVTFGENSSVSRWTAAEGALKTGRDTNLGASAASAVSISLEQGCTFRSLYAPVIETAAYDGGTGAPLSRSPAGGTPEEIGPGQAEGPYVTANPVVIRSGAVVSGSIKSHSYVIVENGARVDGGIFAESDIFMEGNCSAEGPLLAQGRISLGSGTVIGSPGGIKSVIAKKGLRLAGGVRIFGHAATQGRGEAA